MNYFQKKIFRIISKYLDL